MIHNKAIVESATIGKNTNVWAFAHILSGAEIGDYCNICDHVFIENEVKIGDRVTIKCGVQLWNGIVIEDDVFIGPNATFTNDLFPRSKKYPDKWLKTILRQGCSIGANATILPGIEIGQMAMIGAGAVVTQNVPAFAIVVGNPAKIIGYTESNIIPDISINKIQQAQKELPGGASLILFKKFVDLRGSLIVSEVSDGLPFVPKRFFVVYDVPTSKVRGEHAHKECHQLLTCQKGSCSVLIDDGKNRAIVELNEPEIGLYIPPMVWATQFKHSADALLLVLASHEYEPEDYIRSYDLFIKMVNRVNE